MGALTGLNKMRFSCAISKIGVLVLVDESDAPINDSECCREIGQGIPGKQAG
jgi:hypothetical protein